MSTVESIVLYSYWRSSCAWRVRIALELKGLAYTLKTVNIKPGTDENKTQAFQALNALGQVPVLECNVDGEPLRLTQSLAILDLLERVVPEPALYPSDVRQRAQVIEAAEIINSGIQPLQNSGVQTRITAMGGDALSFARGFVARGLVALEARASERGARFSVGEALSIADVLLVPQLYAARRLGVDVGEFPKLCAIEARCAELEAFGKAHPSAQPDCPKEEQTKF